MRRPILAVAIRENVLEPLKLGLISGYLGAFSKFFDEHRRHFYRGVPPGLKSFLQKINYFPGINRTQVSRDFAAFIDYHYTCLSSTKETVSALTSASLY